MHYIISDEMLKHIKLSDDCYYDGATFEITRIIRCKEKGKNKTNNKDQNVKYVLTNMEGEIFNSLIKHNGSILVYDNMAIHFWNSEIDDSIKNLITVYINQIRKLIGDTKREIIQTRSGKGYILYLPPQDPIIPDKNTSLNKIDAGTIFGDSLIATAKTLIKNWSAQNKYVIDTDLLPKCGYAEENYKNLYLFTKDMIKENERRGYYIYTPGGGGKSSSLIYTCNELLEKDDSIIPVFIEAKKVNYLSGTPMIDHLYNIFDPNPDFSENTDAKNRFVHNLCGYLKKNGKKLLLILDGCNEGYSDITKDLHVIKSWPNTYVVLSSRLNNTETDEYKTVTLHSLDKRMINRYLEKNGIMPAKGQLPESLRLPIFISIYADICKKDEVSFPNSRFTLIEKWIKLDLDGKKNNAQAKFTVNCLLPLLAMSMFFDMNPKEHNTMYIRKDRYKNAIKKVSEILRNKDFAQDIEMEYNFNIKAADPVQLINDVILKNYAYLRREDGNEYLVSWSHECYRDWFIAMGLSILKEYSDTLSKRYLKRFLKEAFSYPSAFADNKDYSAYSVALYYAEKTGKDELISINDENYHILLRNIVSFSDDIGDYNTVMEYSDIIIKRNEDPQITTSVFEKAVTNCNLAACLLHIYKLDNSSENDRIADIARGLLFNARTGLECLINLSTEIYSLGAELLNMSPEEVNKRYKKIYDEHLKDKLLRNNTESSEDVYAKLACLGRVYGTLGAYYGNRYDALDKYADADTEKTDALKTDIFINECNMHYLGGLIKYYLWKEAPGQKIGGKMTDESLSIPYRSLGIDMYRARKYERSIEYLEFAKKPSPGIKLDEKSMRIIDANIIRNKVSLMLLEGGDKQLRNLIKDEKKIVAYFDKEKMIGQLERRRDVLYDMITAYGQNVSSDSDTENELIELINMLDTSYERFSLYDDLKEEMMIYLNDHQPKGTAKIKKKRK